MRTSLLYLAVFLILVSSCTKPKDFEYRDIRDFKINTLGFKQSSVSFELVYYNPNGFGVDLKKIESDVYIDSLYLGKFQLDTLMHINRMSEFVLPATIQVDMANMLKNSARMLLKKEVLIQAKGTVKAGKAGVFKSFPFQYEGKKNLGMF
ncbi:MAG TPA: LEA type 2 family protein [Sediminibacterium sp.]|nr:LEA type 2 family protein [Sediminibacterium sp.]